MSALISPPGRSPLARAAQFVHTFVVRRRLQRLDALRTRLPLMDPDRHALDLAADAAFAQLACEHPEACTCETPGGAE